MSTCNIFFYGEVTKIIPKLSSNTLHICSTENMCKCIRLGITILKIDIWGGKTLRVFCSKIAVYGSANVLP